MPYTLTFCWTLGDLRCGDLTCSEHARCVYDAEKGQPMCECETGFSGDGIRCEAVRK